MATTHTYTALDWQHQPRKVELAGRIIESESLLNLYLTAINAGKHRYAVNYGLHVTRHKTLTAAAKEYDRCLKHAKACLSF